MKSEAIHKREAERELRRAGVSKKEAMRLVAEGYRLKPSVIERLVAATRLLFP